MEVVGIRSLSHDGPDDDGRRGPAAGRAENAQMVLTMQLPRPVPPMSFIRHAVDLGGNKQSGGPVGMPL